MSAARRMRIAVYWYPIVLLVVVCCFVLWVCWINTTTTVILVRHAEKAQAQDSNPGLTAAGQARAAALVDVDSDGGVKAVYATEWCRTALTAEPTAVALELELAILRTTTPGDQLSGCGLSHPFSLLDPNLASSADLAAHVLSERRGQTVLIVGHSNTVPELIEALGAPSLCPGYFTLIDGVCRIPDQPGNDQYDNLFVVNVPRWFPETGLLKARYGDAQP